MNLKEALKAAIDGHNVRGKTWREGSFWYYCTENNYFCHSNGIKIASFADHLGTDFEVIPELLKYSVDVWLFQEPKCMPSATYITEFLFGQSYYSSAKDEGAKRYRVTVEEVQE